MIESEEYFTEKRSKKMSVKIALAGNPNCGKTTLFNALTGANQFVGNWPGVTVEKKEGKLKGHKDVMIMDLPGIYSLSPYTLEEVVARNYLIGERPDAIINIIDGTNIERNLYLSTQLMELGIPVIMAVNMIDILEKSGDTIRISKLAEKLGCEVVEISALKGTGVKKLAEKAVVLAQKKQTAKPVLHPVLQVCIDKCVFNDFLLFWFLWILDILDQLLSLPDAQLLVEDSHRQFILLFMVVDSQKGSGMSGRDHIVHDHLLNLLIQLQKTHGVGDGCPALGYPLRHFVLLQVESFQKLFVCHSFLNRIQVLPLNILDQADLYDLLLGILFHDDRHFFHSRHLRGPPSSLPGDDLIVVLSLPYKDGLDHAKLLDRIRQFQEGILLELLTGLLPVGLYHIDVHHLFAGLYFLQDFR